MTEILSGYIYGAFFDVDKMECYHIEVNEICELSKIAKSKYVQSEIKTDLMKKMEAKLRNDIPVLFVGTPCQCAGVKSYMNCKEIPIDNLLLVDLVCHGTPGRGVLREYILHELQHRVKENLHSFTFRDKKKYSIHFNKQDDRTPYNDFYYHSFMSSISYRESC